ncbi:MAG: hypothetical protein ACLP6E_00640, partial [Acidimicrobiales bacterium]
MNSVQITADSPPVERRFSAFYRLGAVVARRRRAVLWIFVVAVVTAGGLGFQLFGALKSGGFNDPGSQSARAESILSNKFGVDDPVAAMVVTPREKMQAPATTLAAGALVASIEHHSGVASVISYWTSGRPASLSGEDGRAGEVVVFADKGVDSDKLGPALATAYNGSFMAAGTDLQVAVGGLGVVDKAVNSRIQADLARAEAIAVPVT